MNSCASTLHVAIQASGITGEVILPSFTFVASANAVITATNNNEIFQLSYYSWCPRLR
jgi:dTDP-4-amino-4,6-dideoxygalactose transaminase